MRQGTDRFRNQDKKAKETLEINPKTLAVTKDKGKATSVQFSTKPTQFQQAELEKEVKAKVIISQQQKQSNPELPVFVQTMKLEEKENKKSEAGSKMEQKPDPIVELLESPTWKHR